MAKSNQSPFTPIDINAKQVIAVASGKGGVGKSTVSVNLALAMAESGQRVGLLDADIYGPNVPLMLGIQDETAQVMDSKILPVEAHGIKVMSVGFITQQEKALIWRGPLANRLIEQFLSDVLWGELDVLLIDLPPGTGDVPLSIIQKCKLAGAIVVTTPHEASIADVRKMLNMFTSTNNKILGLVENMKYIKCPGCDKHIELYPSASGKSISETLGQPMLAEFEFEPGLGIKNKGLPFYIANNQTEMTNSYRELWKKVAATLNT